jgi:CPA2 family monovalent cation:H+ antiporter-2
MRDVFGAFFFLNFGLGLDPTLFGDVLLPVVGAVVMTLVLNIVAGQFVAWLNKLGPQAGINTTVILQNRGEFALILATLAMAAGLDARIVPFAGLYVLVMSILGPILASNSETIGSAILGTKRKKVRAQAQAERDRMAAESIALVEAASSGPIADSMSFADDEGALNGRDSRDGSDATRDDRPTDAGYDNESQVVDRLIQQAMEQSDEKSERKTDPEY